MLAAILLKPTLLRTTADMVQAADETPDAAGGAVTPAECAMPAHAAAQSHLR